MPYTNTDAYTSAGIGDVQYYTYKQTLSHGQLTAFVAEFTSASSAITGFQITGDNGADGSGSKLYGRYTSSSWTGLESGWEGAYKKVYAAGDPSINHLVVAQGPITSQSVGSSTNNDLHDLAFSSGVSKVVYVLWAGTSGYSFSTSYFQSVAEALSSACSVPQVSAQLSGGGNCANTPVGRVGPNGGVHGACCDAFSGTYCVRPFIVLDADTLVGYSTTYPPEDHTLLRPIWYGDVLQHQCNHWCWIMTGIAGSCVGYTTGGAQYFAGGWMYSYAGSVSYDRRYATVQHPTSSGVVNIIWSFDRMSYSRTGTFTTYSCTGF